MGRHSRWLETAKKLCVKSNFPTYRMSALVVRGGRVVSIGLNRLSPGILKSQHYEHGSIHAELDTLLGLDPKDVKGATIYVSGITKGGNWVKSKPCPACQEILKEYGIKMVVYHDREGNLEKYVVA